MEKDILEVSVGRTVCFGSAEDGYLMASRGKAKHAFEFGVQKDP